MAYEKKDPFLNKSNSAVSVFGVRYPSKSSAIRDVIVLMSEGKKDLSLPGLAKATKSSRQLVYSCYEKMLESEIITDFMDLKSRKKKETS